MSRFEGGPQRAGLCPGNVELSQAIYRSLADAGLIYAKPIEQFFDPLKSMFLPDRYIKGECPKCGTKDQYGDVCENCGSTYAPTELKNPYSVLTGAKPELRRSEHIFFRLSDPKVVAFLREWTSVTPLQPEVKNKIAEWVGGRRLAATESGDAQKMPNRCPSNPPIADLNSAPAWNTVKSGTRMPWKARIFLLIDLLRATSSPVGGLPVCCHPCISNTAATAYSCCAFPRKLSQPLKTSSGWNAAS